MKQVPLGTRYLQKNNYPGKTSPVRDEIEFGRANTFTQMCLHVGKLEGVLLQIDSYKGSKKGKYFNNKDDLTS